MKLTAVVITKNEEDRIGACLDSLQFTDEIIVIDNLSTDKTIQIAKEHKANVFDVPGNDFSVLRNIGKDKAQGEWILYVDADEIVTKELQGEISSVVRGNLPYKTHVCYFLKRTNYYLGVKWAKGDRMQRLFLKKALITWKGPLHETAVVNGSTGELNNPLEHWTHRTLSEMVDKTNTWSNVEAKLRYDIHHPPVVWWRLLRVMATGFFRSYIKEEGYKMGVTGWIEGLFQAFSMFITYAKLWELQKNEQSR